jgi:hypothetical protein
MDALKSGDRYLISGGGGVAVADTINHTLVQTAGIVGDTALTLAGHNGKLYCGTTDGLYSSADNGMHWTFAGLSGKRINKIAVFDEKLFAATPSGLFMSQDGTAWGTTSCPLTLCTDIEGMGDRLFVSSFAGLVMYHQNSWIPVGAGLLGTGINALVSRNNVLYAGTSLGSVMYSQDYGETWADISNPSFNSVTGLDIWDGHIYASEAQSGIWLRFIGYPQQVDELHNQGITLYPVPAGEWLTVQLPAYITGPATIAVLNMQGMSLMEIQDDHKTVQVDLKNLAEGMYLLKVRCSGRTFTSRFIHL